LTYEPWMQHLRAKDVNNGALVALDYETGEIVAYVGSADYYAAKASRQFQPKFDVLADGWRQPGSAFKPFNYVTGIEDRTLTPATMLMDVTTDFGGGYTPTDADNLERGPVRVRDALRFSLNIPSVKAAAVNGVDHVFAKAQQFGLRFRTETTGAGLSIALGTEEVHPVDLVTGYGTLANGGRHIGHTTILQILDGDGHDVVPAYAPPTGEQAVSAQAAYLVTDILAGNTDPKTNPFWGKFEIDASDGTRRPATLKTGTNNDARDLNAYGFIAPPDAAGRRDGEYALAVGAWNGNSDNSVVSTPDNPVFSIDVTTYVWQGFMQEVTAAWPVRDFARPDGLVEAKVDPWTGLQPGRGGKSVTELFIAGTEPGERVPSVEASAPRASPAGSDGAIGESASPAGGEAPSPSSARTGTNSGCAEAVLAAVGYESRFAPWLAADRAWLARAVRGPGVAGGPERTRTAYFYNGQFRPYGASWGPFSGIGCLRAAPSPPPTESPSPCPPDVGAPGDSPSPADSAAPIASSGAPCLPAASPSPLESASPSPSESPSPSPSPSPGATPTPVETPPPTAPPPPAPTPPPAAPATPAAPAASPTP
ncbi:MAG TPA: penicillin-binding transpeptidase domain-containing protein, partial [Candidatus Limnocylindrales bacterium]